jgi:outer membrane lipoprotein SlyB
MKLIHALLIIFAVSGCASQKIIIDKEGVDMSKYRQDLETRREYAEEVESGSELAQGAVGGAVIGGAVGAILGGSSASAEKSQVIKNCLRGRGYRVLN